MEKYFPSEDWESSYASEADVIKRVSKYTRLNFNQVLKLPYSYFLLLNKESWVDSYRTSKEGRELLKTLWRLQQTCADTDAVKAFNERKSG